MPYESRLVTLSAMVVMKPLLPLITAAASTIAMGYPFLGLAKRFFCSDVRPYTPDGHRKKNGTPTLGGLLIIGMILANSLLFIGWNSPTIWIIAATLLSFGSLGAWDDWQKIRKGKGIKAKTKFGLQLLTALGVMSLWIALLRPVLSIWIPILDVSLYVGWFAIPWAMFVVIACANAVNLTDGLDGLAAWCLMPNFLLFMIVGLSLIPSISIISAIIAGVLLGFAWFNSYPAQLFMGDVGSLALGAALAMVALMLRVELILPISAAIFMLEVISVILQIGSYKLRGKRLFKMAPLHHHFELSGIAEPKIVMRAFIVSVLLCGLTLMAFYR